MTERPLPLDGLRVLDFGHTVMGPTAGLVLADLGAEVIRVEPASGDPTRKLKGFGTGYFPFYNRNKRSVSIDLKDARGLEVARRLIATADVLIENFGPGTMQRLGLGYDQIAGTCPEAGLPVAQGVPAGPLRAPRGARRGRADDVGACLHDRPAGASPLRAGASVIDVMGGVMGVVAVQAALAERERTGKGQFVTSALLRKRDVPDGPAPRLCGALGRARAADAGPRLGMGDL